MKLNVLDKRITAFKKGYRQNLALINDDPQEISYLLEEYFSSNSNKDIIYIFSSTNFVSKNEFFKGFAFSLLSNFSNQTDTLDNLILTLETVLPLTCQYTKRILKNRDITFSKTLELINTFIVETQNSSILIIEEFQELSSLFDDFYQSFSNFIILQRRCMAVITSSNPKEAQKALSGELNLLFGNFEKIFLNENNFLNNFLYLKGQISHLSPTPFFISYFVNILGSNSLYYKIFAQEIKAKYNENSEETVIHEILKENLFKRNTYFFQRYINKITYLKTSFKDFSSILKLLLGLSQGYIRKKELQSLEIYDSKELNNRLGKLLDLNYLENLGNIYKIKDPLFSFWLSNVFKFYHLPSILNKQKREILFRKNIIEHIDLFKEEFYKDNLKKILQLFSSFQNDNLYVGKDKYMLPLISKAKMISYPQKDFHLIIGEGKGIIFAGIKEKDFQDNDIFYFLEKGANIKGKGVKKVFISLDSVSQNAKVIAKNNKVMIWDINDLNRLFSIYNKPAVSWGLDSTSPRINVDSQIHQNNHLTQSKTLKNNAFTSDI